MEHILSMKDACGKKKKNQHKIIWKVNREQEANTWW